MCWIICLPTITFAVIWYLAVAYRVGHGFGNIYFFPQHGGDYPVFMNLVCGAAGISPTRNFWNSYDKLVALSANPDIIARSEFKYTIGTNDFLYDNALISVPSYTNLGFSVIPDYLNGVSHCLTGTSVGASERISTYWQTKLNSLPGIPSLTFNKTVSALSAIPGDTLTYTLVANATGSALDNVVLSDIVPTNTRFSWASDGGTVTNNGSNSFLITWHTGLTLTTGQSLTRTFVVTVEKGLSNNLVISNTAHISAGTLSTSQTSNSVATTVKAPTLLATLNPDPTPIISTTERITYTLTLMNQGGAAATNVTITHTIPTSTNYILNSASHGGSETTSGSKILVWTPTSINANASITRTFMVSVAQTITTGDQLTHLLSVNTAQGHYIQNQAISHSISGTPQLVYLPLIIKN